MTCPRCTALTVSYGKSGQVAIASDDTVAMVDLDHASVTGVHVGVGDNSIGGRDHWLTVGAGNIHSGMKRAFTVERIDALAKRAGDADP